MNSARMFMGISVPVTGDGREAEEMAARAFWQSRDPSHELPELASIPELIKELTQ